MNVEVIPKDHVRYLEEGPKVGAKTVKDSPKRLSQSMDHGPVDGSSIGAFGGDLVLGEKITMLSLSTQRRKDRTVLWSRDRLSTTNRQWDCLLCAVYCQVRSELVNSPRF